MSTIILPPGEEYQNSRPLFNKLNYFGGQSLTPLKDSIKLKDHLQRNRGASLMFFSNMWLDHPEVSKTLIVGGNFNRFFRLLKNWKRCLMVSTQIHQWRSYLWETLCLNVTVARKWTL